MRPSKAGRQRREIHFSGRVQGVGFRYTTRQVAARFAVAGYVKNLVDGRVQMVIEGEACILDAFVAAVEAELDRHIENRQAEVRPATGEFSSFQVRH